LGEAGADRRARYARFAARSRSRALPPSFDQHRLFCEPNRRFGDYLSARHPVSVQHRFSFL
jgi:hypothetical protein